MNQQIKQLIADARKLSAEEEAELMDALLVSFFEPTKEWQEAWAAEADRRWGRYLAGDEKAHDAEAVLADARQRLIRRRVR